MSPPGRWYWRFLNGLWAFVLLSLPLTSFPPIQERIGALVAPLSALPIFILVLVWFLPHGLRRGEMPVESRLPLYFTLAALGSSLGAFLFLEVPSFKDRTVLSQELRALSTLGIGLAFYLVFTAWPARAAQLHHTLRWIHLGGLLLVTWTSLQVYFIFIQPGDFPNWMLAIENLLVVQSPYTYLTGNARVSGLAYEASWFAHQLNVLYFPLWLATTYQRTSVFQIRLWRFSLENLLLVWGMVLFFFSSPRVGMVAFLLMIVFLFVKFNLTIYRRLITQLARMRLPAAVRRDNILPVFQRMVGALSGLLLLGVYAALAFGIVTLSSQRDWRLSLVLAYPPTWEEIKGILMLDDFALLWAGYRFAFLERVTYWVTGWRIFNQFPFFGVGLGNAGFYFPDHLPAIGWGSYEIRDIFYRLPNLPNIKSLWVRLLAETGLVGFTIFTSWFYLLWRSTRLALRSANQVLRMLALAGQLALLAFLVEGFSIDSFAMPYLWGMTGLTAAASYIHRAQIARLACPDAPAQAAGLRPTPMIIEEEDRSQADEQASSENEVGSRRGQGERDESQAAQEQSDELHAEHRPVGI
jgi:hypothetical protein